MLVGDKLIPPSFSTDLYLNENESYLIILKLKLKGKKKIAHCSHTLI